MSKAALCHARPCVCMILYSLASPEPYCASLLSPSSLFPPPFLLPPSSLLPPSFLLPPSSLPPFSSLPPPLSLPQTSGSQPNVMLPIQVLKPNELFYSKIIPLLKEKGLSEQAPRKDWPHAIQLRVLKELMAETPADLLAKYVSLTSVCLNLYRTEEGRVQAVGVWGVC